MKRVGLVITNLAGSGAEKIVIQQARMFQAKNFNVHIFLLEKIIAYDNLNDLNIHYLSKKRNIYKVMKTFGGILLSNRLKNLIDKIVSDGKMFDLFLSNSPAADRVMHVAKLPNTKYIIHSSYAFEINEFKEMGKVRRANKKLKLYHRIYQDKDLITVSKGAAEDLKRLEIAYRSCRTIYNPFDFDHIRNLGAEEIDTPKENYLLSASAFRFVKRHDILLEAYAMLKDPPPLKFLCPPNPELEALIRKFGLGKKVEILGFKTNPYTYIKNAKLLLLSSEREGLPTVLIEALILGTPVVSTDCVSGPSEILTGDLSRYLAQVNDSKSLSSKIELALNEYPTIEPHHIAKFDEETIFRQFLEIIDKEASYA